MSTLWLFSLFSLFLDTACIPEVDVHARQRRSNIPCGKSFTPCSRGPLAFGASNSVIEDDSDDVLSGKILAQVVDQDKKLSRIVTHANIVNAAKEAKRDVDKTINETEKILFTTSRDSDSTLAEINWSNTHRISRHAKDLSYSALISVTTTQQLRGLGLSPAQIVFGLPTMEIDGTALSAICPVNSIVDCAASKYRTLSGHCNNVNHPLRGAVYEPMQRFLKPNYADEVGVPRASTIGASLPNARRISRELINEPQDVHNACALMTAQWAMFIYEDIAQIGAYRIFKGDQSRPLPCCDPEKYHPECYAIKVDEDDEFFGKSTRCLSYARSVIAPRENCSLGHREQASQTTSYLDGSHVYGSTTGKARKLRSFKNGRLASRSLFKRGGELLPEGGEEVACMRPSYSQPCFLAGGEYTNLIPTSAAMHTIWMRQHNFVADKLKSVNTHWDDERLYQETRRIVIAQIQHITYNEFLPLLIGKDRLRDYGINLQTHAYDSDYNLNIDSTILNEYASAVGLFFFSLFPERLTLYGDQDERILEKPFGTFFNDPSILYGRGHIDAIIRFLLNEPIRKPGLHMTSQLKNEFLRGNGKHGLDLAAIIIQMGRDHGIPGYTAFRSSCGLRRPSNFSDLGDIVLNSFDVSRLSQLYADIDDVDLFILGLAEKPQRGALVGPTFACIIGKQFQKTRRGDRFWYENFFTPSAFTIEQLNEIRRTSLARILCDNADGIHKIQPNVFVLADNFGNCPMQCNSTVIDHVDFSKWTDQEPRLKLPITKATLEKAIRLGAEHAKRLNAAEAERISRHGGGVPNKNANSAIFTHSSLMAPKRESLRLSHQAAVLRETTKVLIRGEGLEKDERLPAELDLSTLQRLLPEVDVSRFVGNISDFLDSPAKEECLPQPLPCDHTSKYRTFSGWCNNLKFPHYGNAFAPMRRLLDPVYDDGFDSPRTLARNGRKLPSARVVSNAIHDEAPEFHVKYTHMLMQIGQIIDHDFAHSPVSRGPGNTILNCSRCDSPRTLSVHCFPIPIERGDPHFPHTHSNGEPRCLSFARSLLGQLTLGYRNQLDQLTSYIDASFIYGSTECEANSLRLFSQGRLNFTDLGFNKEALPQGAQERDCRSGPKYPCFNAGDERNNEQPGLTVMHTIFLREHNRIATILNRINNFWPDETIYLETRRIMGAKVQHMIYSEWLPIVVGCETAARYDLLPRKTGYYTGYDDRCDATITQEMATAAFRFGHSLIRNLFPRMNGEYQEAGEAIDLKSMFNNESFYYLPAAGHIESVLMGLLGAESMAFDRHISSAIRNHLFQRPGGPLTGLDLPALNIQRGRDHGIPPYNAYREMCGMRRARNFEELRDVMDESSIAAMKSVYANVDDIDLFPGLMSERPLKGALVGPMAACIIAEQFQRLKRCDRFYYENDNPATKFTPGQLAEIRKTTLSKLICVNSQYARRIQPNAFLMPDDLTNAPVKCSELPDMDLYEWLDRKFCVVDHRVINLGKTKRITPCITCTCTTEGPECHSMTIDRCETLLADYLFSEIISDTVCVIQCSGMIRQRGGRL